MSREGAFAAWKDDVLRGAPVGKRGVRIHLENFRRALALVRGLRPEGGGGFAEVRVHAKETRQVGKPGSEAGECTFTYV